MTHSSQDRSKATTIIIIPCYNEELRLKADSFRSFANGCQDISFLFVNDGSTDNTLSVLQDLKDSSLGLSLRNNIDILNLTKNGGKAEAVRQGMLHVPTLNGDYRYIGYWDADLATPLDEVKKFIEVANHGNYDMVLGARILRLGANIKRSNFRHILGRLFATFASIALKIPVYDTQCGAKLFKSSVVGEVFKERFISCWIFDVEILFRLSRRYDDVPSFIKALYEVPLTHWHDESGSKLKVTDFFKAPFELIRMYLKYKKYK